MGCGESRRFPAMLLGWMMVQPARKAEGRSRASARRENSGQGAIFPVT
ncbi:hypothetical protein GALL_364650 [mine drainage metagenome]|uniref:Uncharacterized protein n=1 Tax=mine drainage metagenome TaxID=410659 RepID=A0A1J5R0S3_9ZZZZ